MLAVVAMFESDLSSEVVPLDDGRAVCVRPIERTDAAGLSALYEHLSAASVRSRYFGPHPHLSAEELGRLTDVDQRTRLALIGLDDERVVAVARYEGLDGTAAEVALLVADAYQRHGLATHLLRQLAALAAARGYRHFVARVLAANHPMLDVFAQAGFPMASATDGAVVTVTLDIRGVAPAEGAEDDEHDRERLDFERLAAPG